MASSFKLKGDWKKFKKLVNSKEFKGRLEKNFKIATKANAMLVKRRIRWYIKNSVKAKPNAPLTVLIKGSSRPSFDGGDLFAGITEKIISSHEALIGVIKGTVTAQGEDLGKVAEIVHNGASIPVTSSMRGLFFYLWLAGQGKIPISSLTGRAAELADRLKDELSQIRPLKSSTNLIVIPARPFIADAMRSASLKKKVKENWENAIQKSLEGSIQKDKLRS